MNIYQIKEYNCRDQIICCEYFGNVKDMEERLLERKTYPYEATKWETAIIDFPKEAYLLNSFWQYNREILLQQKLDKVKNITLKLKDLTIRLEETEKNG